MLCRDANVLKLPRALKRKQKPSEFTKNETLYNHIEAWCSEPQKEEERRRRHACH